MWKRIGPLLIVLSVAMNVAFIGVWATHAIGSHWPVERADDHGKVWCPLHRRLNVTDEQWRKTEPRMAEFRRASKALRQEISRNRGEMIDLVASPQPDRQAIAAKQEEIRAGQRRMQQLVIDHLLAEKEVLTPEQQKVFFDMLRQRGGCAGPGRMMGLGRTDADHPAARTCPDRAKQEPAPKPNEN